MLNYCIAMPHNGQQFQVSVYTSRNDEHMENHCTVPLTKRNSAFLLIQSPAFNTSSMFCAKRYSILNIGTDTNIAQ